MNNYENLIDTLLDGRYKITGIVGLGGMAVVYEAEDLAVSNRKVALKMLKDEIGEDEQEVKRFVNESKAVAMLSHPNILHIYDVNVSGYSERKYIVMEFIDGITLKDYISRKGRLNWRESISYTEQILNALGHAHERGIIHRDIKPQNIMLLRNGNIKVADFGIAKIQNSEPLTMTDKAIGTVHYISPEQASGASQITNVSDIYSVGVLMYEMTTGRLPFTGNSPIQIAMMQVNDPPQDPRIINPEIPKGLSQIILKSMSKPPERRYQSAGEMIQQLGMLSANPAVVFETEKNVNGGAENQENQRQNNLPVAVDSKKRNATGNKAIQSQQRRDIANNLPNNLAVTDEGDMQSTKVKKVKPRNKKTGRRRGSRSMTPIISGVTLAFLIVLGLSAFSIILSFLGDMGPKDDIRIPNLEGRIYDDELISELDSQRLRANIEYVFNDNYALNTVVSQRPEPLTLKIFRSSTDKIDIDLKISKGKDSLMMPDYSIREWRQIDFELRGRGILTEVKHVPHDTVLQGFIIETVPGPGEVVDAGDTVIIYISEGREERMTIMPDFRWSSDNRISEREAKRQITVHNLVLKEIKSEHSEVVPYGYVIEQDPMPMRSVPEKSTKVTLTISLGPKE